MTVAFLIPPIDLAVGDRCELTAAARPKLRPKGQPGAVIVADCGDCWRVRFDGNSHIRLVRKAFIQAERR